MGVACCRLADIFRRRIAVRCRVPGRCADRRGGDVRSASRGDGNIARQSRRRSGSSRRRARHGAREAHPRSSRAPAAAPAASGVTSGSATSGPGNLQPTAASETDHQRRGVECAAGLARRRGAGGGAGPDRDPAFRRGQSQPVFSARLQSRPRHRSRHQRRRHAGQHADPWPRPGLRRYQFPDPGTGAVGQRPQGTVLRRQGRFRFRRCGRHQLSRQAAEEHRRADLRQFRLCARAGGGIDRRRRGHAAHGLRGQQI